jgi:hypothetical protein
MSTTAMSVSRAPSLLTAPLRDGELAADPIPLRRLPFPLQHPLCDKVRWVRRRDPEAVC